MTDLHGEFVDLTVAVIVDAIGGIFFGEGIDIGIIVVAIASTEFDGGVTIAIRIDEGASAFGRRSLAAGLEKGQSKKG
jgi:hypothetical protein